MVRPNKIRKVPSKYVCEHMILDLLKKETTENGKNGFFKQTEDFLPYFTSLYPPSDSLAKQVGRVLRSLHVPKDEYGFLISNKTMEQMKQEKLIRSLFQSHDASITPIADCQILLLKTKPEAYDEVIFLLTSCSTFNHTFIALHKTANGLLFYTKDQKKLLKLLKSFL